MKTSKLDFTFSARRVYTACMAALRKCGMFRSITGDESTFRISASKGLPIVGENLTINVISTSSSSCEVIMKSSDKVLFNPFKLGNNVRNVRDLDQFIRNEVYRLCSPSQLGINPTKINLAQPDIKLQTY